MPLKAAIKEGQMLNRRKFLSLTGTAIAAPAIMRVSAANAQEVTLKLHHFLPAVSNPHSKFLKPWADKVGTDSGGRIKIDIFPSMQLGGTPPQLFDQARDGVADLVWTVTGYTPGRFPKIEAFELPFVVNKRATVNSRAIQEYAQTNLQDEFKEVRPICFWAHDHGLIHASKKVATLDDLKGLKLRFPTRLAGEALKALGANAIGMPVPQVPEAIAQRVIDGAVVPWEVVPALKLQELVKFHTEIPGSPTLYTTPFILAMNKAKYDSLPADLKKVIDANSGLETSKWAGKVFDQPEVEARKISQQRNNTFITITPAEYARWKKATDLVDDAWMKEAAAKGANGKVLYDEAVTLLKKYGS